MKRVILTTGGTGGHVFPALAVAEEIRNRFPDCNLLFIGGQGAEREMVKRSGIPFKGLPAKGIIGGGFKKILGAFWIMQATALAIREIFRFRPDAVIGFGGYAAFCPVLAGWIMGIPTAIHEQNSVPGVTNRVLGRVVKQIFSSFEDFRNSFPSAKVVVTGNPVRREIISSGTEGEEKSVLVFGGSQGARAINEAVCAALPRLAEFGVTLIHQTGEADCETVRKCYEEMELNAENVFPFIHDMAAAYRKSQLVVCRAGASTVFEVAAAGKPALFIPFPQATHDHQTGNARSLEEIGAAVVIPQTDLNGDILADKIIELISDQDELAAMGRKALSFARPDAASAIVDGLENIIRMKTVRGKA